MQESDATPTAFGDVKVVTHDPDAERIVDLGVDSRPAIATESGGARPCHRADVSTAIDAPDPLVVRVGNVEIPGCVEREAVGVFQRGRSSRPPTPAEAACAGSRHDGHDSRW